VSDATIDSGFLRHVRACNNAHLPGERLPFLIGADQVGWVTADFARALAGEPQIEAGAACVVLADAAALAGIARTMSERGFYRWRREDFDVRAIAGGPVLGRIDRGAIPAFGIQATGVHLNGLVRQADGLHVWVARRARNKALDPGKLDHIVAGGVPAGLTSAETLVKEAAEEAAIPPDLAARAREVGVLSYAMERPEGLRRDKVHCYDLELPADFVPRPADGEVEGFELWPLARVVEAVRTTDAFKFNVNLVLIDLFIRQGVIVGAEAAGLRAALDRSFPTTGP
jgi:8-oxo-dGTP pyrophosphatase MutT (NUDIX family)